MEIIEGVVAKLAHFKDGINKSGEPTGYANYNLALTDGSTYKFNILKSREPKVGQFVRLEPAKFGQVTLVREEQQGGEAASSNGSNGSPAEKSAYAPRANKDDYFRDKAHYDENIRDPKIEFQSYFGKTMDMYASAIPSLEEPPKTAEEVDAYIDQAFDKARAIFKVVTTVK